MIRVLVADDHRLVREGLRRLLRDAAEIEVVGEAATGDEAIERARGLEPDVLLLDVTMPGPGVLGVIRAVIRDRPRCRVLVLTGHRDSEYAVRAIRAGAAGYLVKDRTAEELLDAVRRVASGRRYLTPAVAELLAEDAARPAPPNLEDLLSLRERQVLELLAAGKSNKEVAGALGLSPKTVSTYRTRLLEKLDLQSNADLVRFALRRHLGPEAV